jgi:hypothetical protein
MCGRHFFEGFFRINIDNRSVCKKQTGFNEERVPSACTGSEDKI